MPAKISTISYVHDSTEHLTQDYTVKEITTVSRLDDDDPTKVIYLKVKAFIPSNQNKPTQIGDFDKGDVIFLKEKFVGCAGWYSASIQIFNVRMITCSFADFVS
jgi:hypothetical protein